MTSEVFLQNIGKMPRTEYYTLNELLRETPGLKICSYSQNSLTLNRNKKIVLRMFSVLTPFCVFCGLKGQDSRTEHATISLVLRHTWFAALRALSFY
jgi:hypothetical protein